MGRFRSLDAKLCFTDGASFVRKTLPGGGLAYLKTARDCPGLREALADPDALFEPAESILKDSRSSKAALSSIPGVGKVFVKRHNSKGLRYALRYLFRKARAFRTWQAAWLLEQLQVPTPEPIAAVAFRKAFLLKGSYLITERVEGLLSASDFVPELNAKDETLDAFVFCVFKRLSLMHDCGISHGDLKFSNIAAVRTPFGEISFAGFIDLDSLKRRASPLPAESRALELARMAASLTAIVSSGGEGFDLPSACVKLARLYEEAGGPKTAPSRIQELSKIWLEKS